MYILLGILSFYMIFYKFVYIDSCIYLELRNNHSKTFLKKNKARNIIDKIFYIRYKGEINKLLYVANILYFVAGVLGYFIIILSMLFKGKESLLENYVVFLVLLSVFSIIIWITTSMLSKLKTYSIILKLLYISLYVVIMLYWLIRVILSVIGFVTK